VSVASALPVLGLASLLIWGGGRIALHLGWTEEGGLRRLVVSLLLGCLAFHLLLTLEQALGIAWSPLAIVAPWSAGLLLSYGLRPRRRPGAGTLPSDLGWGDGAVGIAWLVFALVSATLWITTPDFVFHWGLKAHRYTLAQGVDYLYLARPWNWALHPDYPNLYPELVAASARLAGDFDPSGLMLWTSILFAALLLSGRPVLAALTRERSVRQAGLAFLALACAAFGLGHSMAGAADWMPALALLAATPALLRPPDRDGDLEVSVAAAFAAATKIEGIALAFFLLAVQASRRAARERRLDVRSLAVLGLPSLAVVVPWAWTVRHFHLFQPTNSGQFDLARFGEIGSGLLDALHVTAWHGLGVLVFLAPLLLISPRSRTFGVVATLQLGFFFYVYLSAPVATRFYVVSSFPRLSLQLFPALVTVALGLLGVRPGPGAAPPEI
jgi:hypothetical protein